MCVRYSRRGHNNVKVSIPHATLFGLLKHFLKKFFTSSSSCSGYTVEAVSQTSGLINCCYLFQQNINKPLANGIKKHHSQQLSRRWSQQNAPGLLLHVWKFSMGTILALLFIFQPSCFGKFQLAEIREVNKYENTGGAPHSTEN